MWRELLRVVGLALGGLTLVQAFFAWMFRFDSTDEYHWALQMDLVLGCVAAMCLTLIGIPPVGSNTARYRAVWLTTALLTGVLVAGSLAYRHYEQDAFRSSF